MKKRSEAPEDDLRDEYDFRTLRVVRRGPGRSRPGSVEVLLAPDTAEIFPDSNAVNQALRFLMKITREAVAGDPGSSSRGGGEMVRREAKTVAKPGQGDRGDRKR